jgi:hypothetical protein
MPDDRATVTTRVVLRSKKTVRVSLRHGGVHDAAFAPLSPPILFSVGKSCGGFAWRPRRVRGQRSHIPLSFIASWLPSFLMPTSTASLPTESL